MIPDKTMRIPRDIKIDSRVNSAEFNAFKMHYSENKALKHGLTNSDAINYLIRAYLNAHGIKP